MANQQSLREYLAQLTALCHLFDVPEPVARRKRNLEKKLARLTGLTVQQIQAQADNDAANIE